MAETNFITVDNDFNDVKRRNFFTFEFMSSFVWMFFHFTVVFFFMIRMESLMLVWFFLWLWNFVSFLVDSPIWVLQRYFNPKKLFLAWAYLMIIVWCIFLYFTFETSRLEFWEFSIFSTEAIKWLFSSILNIFLILFSSIVYWITKELSEVTSNSYIMNNTDPSQYSELFSKKSIFGWAGMWVWLILSWLILALQPFIAVVVFILILLLYIFLTKRYFDNSFVEVKSDIMKIKLLKKEDNNKWKNDYKTEVVDNKSDLKEKTKNKKIIFLKPVKVKDQIDINEIIQWTIDDLKSFAKIMFQAPYNYRLLVIWWIFVIFGFWDNFVTTFLIDYIDEILWHNQEELRKFHVQNVMTAYVFIWIICIPAFWAQIPLVSIAQKIWVWKIMIPWLLLSGISMFIFWFASSIYVLLLAWVMNWIWYASCLPISQWEFSWEYNSTYAEKNNLKEIDASASSAPIKMLANLANVLWLCIWWALLQIFGYAATFSFLWLILLLLFYCSSFARKRLKIW